MIKYYPFELHTHTKHSDGDFTPTELVDAAKARGLVGIALTDHNTTSGVSETVSYGTQNGIIVIAGIEWTTFYGHITALGANDIDWKQISKSSISEIAKKAMEEGSAVGIAHPFRIGYPICTGGSDEWGLSSYKNFTHYEVWSCGSPAKDVTNQLAEARYFSLISGGERLAATYGLDWHSNRNKGAYAATYLGIEGAPTADKAINAIKRGNTYVSTGVVMQEKMIASGKEYHLGDSVPQGESEIFLDLSYLSCAYKSQFGVAITEVCFVGSSLPKSIVMPIKEGQSACNMTLSQGYLSIIIYGTIEKCRQKLVITTPYYVV